VRRFLQPMAGRWAGALLLATIITTTSGLSQTAAQSSGTAAPLASMQGTPTATPPPGTPGTPTSTPTAMAVVTPTFTPSPTSSVPVPPILAQVASRHQARMGIYAYHFGTGQVLQLNADQRFRAASLYKLVVLYDAFQRIAAGTLNPDEVLMMSQAALDAEPNAEWPLGTRTSVACALESMIVISSNAGAAMVLERLGGEPQVTVNARNWGLTENTEITKERAFTSPRDVAHLLIAIATDQGISPEANAAMRGLLAAQRRNDRIPLPLPLELTVAHKTGELNRLRHDAGIVYAPSGAYLVVAMVEGAPSDSAARAAILDLSRELYTYFERTPAPSFLGIPPRLARDVLQTPDEQGRLVPLFDADAGTVPLRDAGIALARDAEDSRLREFVVSDLQAMQRAATQAGSPFWIASGYRGPRPSERRFIDPSEADPPCSVDIPTRQPQPTPVEPAQQPPENPVAPTEQPPAQGDPLLEHIVFATHILVAEPGDIVVQALSQPAGDPAQSTATPLPTPAVATPTAAAPPAATPSPTPVATTQTAPGASPTPLPTASPTPSPTPAPPIVASQHWLGTTIAITDAADRDPTEGGVESSATARWLAANAWQYGFIPALPETALGQRIGYEPWRYRWVGRELAGQLRNAINTGDYAGTVVSALRQAEMDLATRAR
jgi:beta-lactamase class A